MKKLSICGNCYFILTLLGVCHVKVNFVCPLNHAVTGVIHYLVGTVMVLFTMCTVCLRVVYDFNCVVSVSFTFPVLYSGIV